MIYIASILVCLTLLILFNSSCYGYSESEKHLSINPESETVYAKFDNSLIVLNGASGKILKNLTVGDSAGFTINPFSNVAYVSRNEYLTSINITNSRILQNISIPNYGFVMSVDDKNDMLYMIDDEANIDFGVLNESDGSTEAYIIDGITSNLEVNPETKRVYILDDEYDRLYTFDSTSRRLISNISNIPNAYAITINPKTNLIYVASQDASRIGIVNGSTNELIRNFVSGTYKQYLDTIGSSLAIDAKTNRLFLADLAEKSISIFNSSTYTLIGKIKSDILLLELLLIQPTGFCTF